METIQELLRWHNLIFVLPFITALGYLLLQAVGGMDFHHDADVHAHFDHDVGVHGHGGHDHDTHVGGNSFLIQVLSVLGVGKIPLAAVFMSLCFLWGFLGWASNFILSSTLPYPTFVPFSVGIALVGSVVMTRYLAIVMGKFMPSTESYGSNNYQLVGSIATARYNVDSDSPSSATLLDEHKNFLEVPCRLMQGEQPIQAGESIILLLYNEEDGYFEVSRNPLMLEEKQKEILLTNGE